MSAAADGCPVRPGEPTQSVARDDWLFRRVTPDPHPLRDMLQQVSRPQRSSSVARHGGGPLLRPAALAPMPRAEAGPALLFDAGAMSRLVHQLPPLPRALSAALGVLRDAERPADTCVRAIEQDASLAARVLKLANSPFYGVSGRVSRIGDAVLLLGLRTVANVVVAVSVRGVLAGPREQTHFHAQWQHALATAITSRELASDAGVDPDEAFLAGLLHDLGHLVLAVFAPGPAREAREDALVDDTDLREAERRRIGHSHDEVGAAVARHWSLPDPIVATIRLHHRPSDAVEPGSRALASVVHVAAAIAHAMDLDGDPAETVPGIDAAAWRSSAPSDGVLPKIAQRLAAGVALLAVGD